MPRPLHYWVISKSSLKSMFSYMLPQGVPGIISYFCCISRTKDDRLNKISHLLLTVCIQSPCTLKCKVPVADLKNSFCSQSLSASPHCMRLIDEICYLLSPVSWSQYCNDFWKSSVAINSVESLGSHKRQFCGRNRFWILMPCSLPFFFFFQINWLLPTDHAFNNL